VSSQLSPKQALQSEAQGLLADFDTNRQIVAQPVWDSAFTNAARDLTRWQPLRKLTPTITVQTGDTSATLPSDFIEIDEDSFNRAVNPSSLGFSYSSYVFTLASMNAASGGFGLLGATGQPFPLGTRFEFTDDGAGGKLFTWDQPVQLQWDIQFAYLARHSVTDTVSTLPEDIKDLFLLKACKYACQALARQLAGDKYLNGHYKDLAAGFEEDFIERTRFRPIGRAG
jgi:hypothetical protein